MADNISYTVPVTLYHHNSNIKTVSDFLKRGHIYENVITPEEFFENNRMNILNAMTTIEKWEYGDRYDLKDEEGNRRIPEAGDLVIDMILPCPCNFTINSRSIDKILAISQTNLLSPYDDVDALIKIKTADLSYSKWLENKIKFNYVNQNNKRVKNSLYKLTPSCTCFGWFKSAMFVTDNNKEYGNVNNVQKGFFDLSPFIISQSTNQTSQNGSWQITLPFFPINPEDATLLDKVLKQLRVNTASDLSELMKKGINNKILDIFSYNYVNGRMEFIMKTPNTYEDISEQSIGNFFEWLISSNDLMFLAFEDLRRGTNELNNDGSDLGAMYIPNREYTYDRLNTDADRTFDMIGLVDSVRTVVDVQSGNTYTEISGRDLMKLLIEDGSFFFDISVSGQQEDTVFANEKFNQRGDIIDADKLSSYNANPIGRLRRVMGEIDVLKSFINMDVSFVLKTVISRLSNIEIVPDGVFESWGDRRTKFMELVPDKIESLNDIDK
jgi:hypothetical protein